MEREDIKKVAEAEERARAYSQRWNVAGVIAMSVYFVLVLMFGSKSDPSLTQLIIGALLAGSGVIVGGIVYRKRSPW